MSSAAVTFSSTCHTMQAIVEQLQDDICAALETQDTVSFKEDQWERPGGGGGKTRVIENGDTFEKGGVNTSAVFGAIEGQSRDMFAGMLAKQGVSLNDNAPAEFFATGISLVIHPQNPHIPTTHANYRYFELQNGDQEIWWFGGGADLTPYYLDEADAATFHQAQKAACDALDTAYYPEFKNACDDYFHLPHRNEHRGIGGTFYDYKNTKDKSHYQVLAKKCGQAFIDGYVPIVARHKDRAFTDQERHWQLQRRGRYAEFNLVYDRGTLFGLKTNGRIESILMSLPPLARWDYNIQPEPGSPEAALIEAVSNPRNWV